MGCTVPDVLKDFCALEISGTACGMKGTAPPHPRRLASSATSR